MRRVIPVVIALVVSAGCLGRAPIATNPTTTEQAFAQRKGAEIADAVTSVLEIADATGAVIDASPLDAATKDQYDCGVIKVAGLDNPSPTVLKVCGPENVRPRKDTVLAQARDKLKAVTACPSLGATALMAISVIDPWMSQLMTSQVPSLVLAGTAVKTAFAATRLFLDGGAKCSQ